MSTSYKTGSKTVKKREQRLQRRHISYMIRFLKLKIQLLKDTYALNCIAQGYTVYIYIYSALHHRLRNTICDFFENNMLYPNKHHEYIDVTST